VGGPGFAHATLLELDFLPRVLKKKTRGSGDLKSSLEKFFLNQTTKIRKNPAISDHGFFSYLFFAISPRVSSKRGGPVDIS
jgi:hypothetical protein